MRRRTDPGPLAARAPQPATAPSRGRPGFGGVVPVSAHASSPGVNVAALTLEHHVDGAALALLVLADAPGVIRVDPAAIGVRDDAGTTYSVTPVARWSGLGAVQVTLWLSPAVPAAARRLDVDVDRVARTSVARGGGGVERALSGAPWSLAVDLRPPRTAAPAPPHPGAAPPPPPPARVPVRALSAHRGVVPVGQARMAGETAVCVWAVERYADRAVVTLAALGAADATALAGGLQAWDDRGGAYRTAPLTADGRDGWAEAAVELAPAPPAAAAVLALRVDGGIAGGPHLFGVTLPATTGGG